MCLLPITLLIGLVPDLHLEPLLAVLAPVKAKWFQFGMALNLSENFLDETATNIETAEECLSDILKNWLQYHEPSMEALNYALSRINENPIAFNASQRGIYTPLPSCVLVCI